MNQKVNAEVSFLVDAIRQGDARAVGRAISELEDNPEFSPKLIRALTPHYQKKPRLGLTGSPGVGKSTLINQILKRLRARGLKVSVVAVDATSPFSGGAILGDRIRMADAQSDPGVFIRSMGSRGSLGGLSASTANAVRILEVFGSDIVIIETVGMGQTGFDIVDIADSVVLLLSPESGNGIQTMKAGVMEIADIYVINKSDRAGADALFAEVSLLLSSVDEKLSWKPPIVRSCALTGEGVEEIIGAFEAHQRFLTESSLLEMKRVNQIVSELKFLVEARIKHQLLDTKEFQQKLAKLAKMVQDNEIDTYSAADLIIQELARKLGKL